MSTKSYFPVSCKIFEVDFFFRVGEPPKAFKLEPKNRFKSSAKYLFLESSHKKSSNNRSSSQSVLIVLLLALYKFTNIKGSFSIVTSAIGILLLLSLLVLPTEVFFIVMNPIMTWQELVVPREKYSCRLNSLCHSLWEFSEECVSYKNIIPLLQILLFKYSNISIRFLDDRRPIILFDTKFKLSAIDNNNCFIF